MKTPIFYKLRSMHPTERFALLSSNPVLGAVSILMENASIQNRFGVVRTNGDSEKLRTIGKMQIAEAKNLCNAARRLLGKPNKGQVERHYQARFVRFEENVPSIPSL